MTAQESKLDDMTVDVDGFFAGYPASRHIFDELLSAMNAIGPTQLRVTKSQVAFRHRKAFAWAWIPAKHLKRKAAPLVLTVGLRFRHSSPRWKEIVEPYPGHFTHHIELYSSTDIDSEVVGWLKSAWETAA